MNNFIKFLIATLGAINVVFGQLFIPLSVATMSVIFFNLTGVKSVVILVLGILTTLYRAIDVGLLNKN